MKTLLNDEEKEYVIDREKGIESVQRTLEAIEKFKVGDYLIAFAVYDNYSSWGFNQSRQEEKSKVPVTNSYGAIKKYKVLHVDKHGVSYIKELNKNGKPYGALHCQVSQIFDRDEFISVNDELKFEIDPEYIDATLLQEVDSYDPMGKARNTADTKKAIDTHNKANKINVHTQKDTLDFIKTLKVGDVIWRSTNHYFTVTAVYKNYLTPTRRLKHDAPVFDAQDNKGSIHQWLGGDVPRRNFYHQQPKSLKKSI